MRKDVRMGFAVGGVLLAVIVVAVLVFHRNKNASKAVALDTDPQKSAPVDAASPDVSPAKTADAPAVEPKPIEAQPLTPGAGPAAKDATGPKAAATDSPEKAGDKWDVLFNSTAEDPIKAQLTNSPNGKSKNSKKKRKVVDATSSSAAAPTVTPEPVREDAREPARASAPQTGSANIPLEATTGTEAEPAHSPVVIADPARAIEPPLKEPARTHTIAAGETFVSISRAVYGDGKYYTAIENANPNVNPDKLKPGMTIQLPPASQVKAAHKSAKPSAAGSSSSSAAPLSRDGKTYTVQKNDSLYKIAKKVYGSGTKSDDLYAANKQTIGPDSTRLQVGMVLTLPEAPTVR